MKDGTCRSFRQVQKKTGDDVILVRVRNIKQAYLYIKEQDSETAITESAFRSIVKSGLIPTFTIGSNNRRFVKLDDVDKFLQDVTGVIEVKKKKKEKAESEQEKIRKQEI